MGRKGKEQPRIGKELNVFLIIPSKLSNFICPIKDQNIQKIVTFLLRWILSLYKNKNNHMLINFYFIFISAYRSSFSPSSITVA
jgi:hypothetical protein